MTVVLRCPSCGTTKARPGECEACHDAQVDYFCTNHAPGIWLDTATCRQCGARFGAMAAPTAPTTPTKSRHKRPPTPVRMPLPASVLPAGYTRPPPRTAVLDDAHAEPAGATPGGALWQALLRAALTARRPAPLETRAARGVGLGGCVMRLLLLAVIAFVALLSALFFFGRSLLY